MRPPHNFLKPALARHVFPSRYSSSAGLLHSYTRRCGERGVASKKDTGFSDSCARERGNYQGSPARLKGSRETTNWERTYCVLVPVRSNSVLFNSVLFNSVLCLISPPVWISRGKSCKVRNAPQSFAL